MKIVFVICIFLIFLSITQISYGSTESCQCVAFRFDDIQDYWLNNVQTKVIDTFQQKNASLTIALIANYLGNDQKLENFINERDQKKYTKIEVANHGLNHEIINLF